MTCRMNENEKLQPHQSWFEGLGISSYNFTVSESFLIGIVFKINKIVINNYKVSQTKQGNH